MLLSLSLAESLDWSKWPLLVVRSTLLHPRVSWHARFAYSAKSWRHRKIRLDLLCGRYCYVPVIALCCIPSFVFQSVVLTWNFMPQTSWSFSAWDLSLKWPLISLLFEIASLIDSFSLLAVIRLLSCSPGCLSDWSSLHFWHGPLFGHCIASLFPLGFFRLIRFLFSPC